MCVYVDKGGYVLTLTSGPLCIKWFVRYVCVSVYAINVIRLRGVSFGCLPIYVRRDIYR